MRFCEGVNKLFSPQPNMHAKNESVILSTLRALVPYLYRALRALVIHVPCALRTLVPHLPRAPRASWFTCSHVSRFLSALVPHVSCALRALGAAHASCPAYSCAPRP